ncbi:TetR/AcrR family transcriptional regulator [Alkalihalophilus pseudofirmus OF4]|uniref:TetR/AcrR family transcriptional regulator n=1 Tax=Alkalihalophilus pseudofirmus (strain ATCC BAA-2126 / JCM 17055 / OF4) TaxID=398511 RepID=D3FXX4_ALKPO|nr:TetR/AcrR family transcriptional regulator [Alkalihalophilus pseudofirmus]ADC50733.1 TetR/AcrR family transcriptional regulator [Alkalihalophilus pseudofirmus OF4]
MQYRQQKAMLTRKKILDAALELFTERGFDEVKVSDIVKKSATSKGAFYTHFSSKYEIFLEKFKEIDDFYIAYEQEQITQLTPLEFLSNLHKAQVHYLENELGKDTVRTIYMNVLRSDQNSFVSDRKRPYFHIVKKFIKKGQEDGSIRDDMTCEVLAAQMTKAVRGNIYDWCSNEKFDLEKEQNYLLSILLEGLKKT